MNPTRAPSRVAWLWVAVGVVVSACGPRLSTTRLLDGRGRITQVRLSVSNVFVVEEDEGVLLVDSGDPGQAPSILDSLARAQVDPSSVRLLVITHAHADHIGSAAALQATLHVPVALAVGDLETAERGHNPRMHPTGPTAELLLLVLEQSFDPVAPDVPVAPCLSLVPYGVRGTVYAAPGHTPGSSVVLLEGGDAIVGDLALGGHLGGAISPEIPTEHYFQEHPRDVRAILEWLLSAGARRFHLGHGGPVLADHLRTALEHGELGPPPTRPFAPACPSEPPGR